MKFLTGDEWAKRRREHIGDDARGGDLTVWGAGTDSTALSLTAYQDNHHALVDLRDVRLLVGPDTCLLVTWVDTDKWAVLYDGPLGGALTAPIVRRTPGESEAYRQGYRAALQYVREKVGGLLDAVLT